MNRDQLEMKLRDALATMTIAELSRVDVTVGSIERLRMMAQLGRMAKVNRLFAEMALRDFAVYSAPLDRADSASATTRGIISLHSEGDRRRKYCRCHRCGEVSRCTPSFDFYREWDRRIGGYRDELTCERCFQAWKHVEVAERRRLELHADDCDCRGCVRDRATDGTLQVGGEA